MKEIAVSRRTVNEMNFLMLPAQPYQVDRVIDDTCLITLDGKPLIAYIRVREKMDEIREAVKSIRYEKSTRSGGLPTVSRIFGYNPRSTLRKDFCSSTSLAIERPDYHHNVCAAGELAARYYREFNPALFEKHMAITEQNVLPEYRIQGTPFTSGIINKNNVLRYHRDNGNFKDVWSAMFVFKNAVVGGDLVVPEIDCMFKLHDRSLFLFDGQGLIHGVTPIQFMQPDSYRYSVVYYSLQQIWKCRPVDEEVKRIRALKTARERKRAQQKAEAVS